MTSLLIQWSCPFCDTSKRGLTDGGGEKAAMIGLNTHLRKLADETHGGYGAFPTDWDEEDAHAYVSVVEVGDPSSARPSF